MAGISIEGNISGISAEVNSNNQLQIDIPLTSSQSGFVGIVSENDAGIVTGSRSMYAAYSSDDCRLNIGQTTPLFDYQFTNTVQDTNFWFYKASTMAATQGGGFLLLNSASSNISAAGVFMQSWRYFKITPAAPILVTISVNLSYAVQANQIAEFGLFLGNGASGTIITPTDGVYFRLTSSGLIGVINYGNTETVTSPLGITLSPGTVYQLGMVINTYQVEFWNYNSGTLLAVLPMPVSNATVFASMSLPICVQQRNIGIIATSPMMQLKVASIRVDQIDLSLGQFLPHIEAAQGNAYQTLPGNATQNTISNYTNNLVLTAGALTNATLNIAAGASIGGILAVNPTLAAGTDGLLFSYTNPVGAVSQIPRTLVITGVQIHGAVSTTLTGGPVIYIYSIEFGSNTATSLAAAQSGTFSSGTTKSIRNITIGIESYAATSPAGTLGATIPLSADFAQSPIVVNPGENIGIMVRNVGTVTSAGAITIAVAIKHYWI